MSNAENSTDTNNALEGALKDLLDKMLTYFEKFIVTKEDLDALQTKLNDYENLLELVEITKDVFVSLTEKIDEKLQSSSGDSDYDELEKVLQKHESEIRNHIRIEQQLKLYAESIQAKLDECEKSKLEVLDQTKAMINNVKRDNQKLSDTLKIKSEENEKLNLTVRSLEELKKEYESKFQGLPNLHDRINHFDKKKAATNSVILSKDPSQSGYGVESVKKIDLDPEYSKILNSKPESARKSLKTLGTSQYTSPMKFIQKTLSNASNSSNPAANRSKEYVRVKLEVTDNKNRKEIDGLKSSYQRFYNPGKALSRERDRERDRHSNSMSKTRELKAIYSIPLVTHSSNSSLLQANPNLSHRDFMITKLHQRSNSHGARNKSGTSFIKAENN